MLAFIVNPVAGKGRGAVGWQTIVKHLDKTGTEYKVYTTEKQGDGGAKAAQALKDGATRLVAVGGDGTLHEVLNTVYGRDVEIGIIPLGTGNDFVRTAGIPSDLLQATTLAVTGTAKPTDLGRVHDQLFVNVSSLGFDAEVGNDTNHRRMVINGTITYLVSVFAMLRTYRCAEARITIDGREIRGRILLMAVGNAQYYGGGMKIVPGGVIDDGLLDVVVAGDLTKFETLTTLPKIYSGRHIEHPKASVYQGKKITIETSEPLCLQADGEIIGTTPATFEILAGALKIVR